MDKQVSRRHAVATGFAVGAGVALSQAVRRNVDAQAPASSPAASSVADGWSFTDDRGVTISLPERPTRVIAQTSSAATLWDFGIEVVGFLGPNDADNKAGFPQVGDMDVSQISNIGDYGTLDLEQAIALDPQLYVDLDRGGDTLWYLDADSQAALEKFCPTVGLNADGVSVITIVQRYEDLAVALGADPEGTSLVAAKEAFAASEAAFTGALARNPGLRVLTVSSDTDGSVVIWNPNWLPDLLYFTEMGFIGVDVGVDAATPNAHVSIETLGTFAADVILFDARDDLEAMDGNPVWQSLPAVRAGQVGRWYAAFPYSWQKLGNVLDLTTETLAAAKPIV